MGQCQVGAPHKPQGQELRLKNQGSGTLTVDADSVVGLGLLSVPVGCPAPESALVLDPHRRQEEGAVGEDVSHAVP